MNDKKTIPLMPRPGSRARRVLETLAKYSAPVPEAELMAAHGKDNVAPTIWRQGLYLLLVSSGLIERTNEGCWLMTERGRELMGTEQTEQKMSMENLAELKKTHDDYIARAKASGAVFLTYRVPCCGGELEGRAAPAGEKWDTLSTCPHCGSLYMKISTAEAIAALVPEVDQPPSEEPAPPVAEVVRAPTPPPFRQLVATSWKSRIARAGAADFCSIPSLYSDRAATDVANTHDDR